MPDNIIYRSRVRIKIPNMLPFLKKMQFEETGHEPREGMRTKK